MIPKQNNLHPLKIVKKFLMGQGNAYEAMIWKKEQKFEDKHFQTSVSKGGIKYLKMLNVRSDHSY